MYAFIAAEKTNYPVSLMCRVLGISRTAFHAWERRPPSDRDLHDLWLLGKIKEISAFAVHRPAAAHACWTSWISAGVGV